MRRFLILLFLLSPTPLIAVEEAGDPVVAKLREALRASTLQLRDAQGKIADLQASEIASERKITKLEKEIKNLKAEAVKERNVQANAISELQNELTRTKAASAGHQTAVGKWRKEYGEAIERARKAEAATKKSDSQVVKLKRLVESQRYQNIRMYKVGMEILDRYDNFWFGDALLAREPFVGNTRVKLQNLAQEGQDKLLAARIRNEEGAGTHRSGGSPPETTNGQSAPASQPVSNSVEPPPEKKKPRKEGSSASSTTRQQDTRTARGKPDQDGTQWPVAEPM